MLKRLTRIVTLIIVASYFFSDGVVAQTRRSQPRRARSTRQKSVTPQVQPLTEKQKDAIMNLIKTAKDVEITYNYESQQFADRAYFMLSSGQEVGKLLPEGNIKSVMLEMALAYSNAGFLYARVTHTGIVYTLDRSRQDSEDYTDLVPLIIEQYGLERATPFQAVRFLLGVAAKSRETLQGMIAIAPVIPEPSSNTPSNKDAELTQTPTPEPEAIQSPLVGSWTIEVTAPDNQRLTLKLIVKQENERLNCIIEGGGEQKPCTASGSDFSFKLRNVPLEGQTFDVDFSGTAEADSLKGKLNFSNASGLSITLPLKGTRIKQ